jgi:hypothetical protein
MNRFYELVRISEGHPTALTWSEFREYIGKIPQYDDHITYRLECVRISDTLPLCTSVQQARVQQAFELLNIYERFGLEPFVPVRMTFPSFSQIIFPPLVEKRTDGRQIVLDGMHRLFAAQAKAYSHLHLLTLTGAEAPLPSIPVRWETVKVVEPILPVAAKMLSYDPTAFTKPYTETFNAESWWTGR